MDYFDILLAKKLNGGGGGDIDLQTLNVTENGTVNAPSGVAYNKVITNVPAPANALFKQTLSGLPAPIASFVGADAPIDSLKASIVGVQSGSGDPSPENERPISGWSSANVTRTGKNLIDDSEVLRGYFNQSGNFVDSTKSLSYEAEFKAGTYTFSTDLDNCVITRYFINDDVYEPVSETQTLTINSNVNFDFRISIRNASSTVISTTPQTMIERGEEATTYEPYNGNTYTIPFKDSSDNPINVYRGTIDVSTGVATFTHKLITLNGSETWGTTSGVFRVDVTGYKKGEFINGACNAYKMVSEAYNAASMDTDKTCSFVRNADFNRFMVKDSSFASVSDFQTWLSTNNLQVAYELETPITMQFDPIALRSDGVTNLYVNCGEVTECIYFSDNP